MRVPLINGDEQARRMQQVEAMLKAEQRQLGAEIYKDLVIPYLQRIVYQSPEDAALPGAITSPQPDALRQLAALAAKCAPYLQEAFGLIRVSDAALWGEVKPEVPAEPSAIAEGTK